MIDSSHTAALLGMTLQTHDELSAIGMFLAADWVVKTVMLLLVFSSILSWTIMLVKRWQLRNAAYRAQQLKMALQASDRLNKHLDENSSTSSHPASVSEDKANVQNYHDSFHVTRLLNAAKKECNWMHHAETTREGVKERVSQRLVSEEKALTAYVSKHIGLLASIGSTAPFIGLFGTVWGIMNSFISIAASKSTQLSVVAPGIAEALLATAAGLIAAIPAVLFYNYFSRGISHYRSELSAISSELMILVSRYLDEHGAKNTTRLFGKQQNIPAAIN